MPKIQRLGIITVGTFDMSGGQLIPVGWEFSTPIEGVEMSLEAVDGKLGGWSAFELHTIAHGAPCECPAGRDHQARGWLG